MRLPPWRRDTGAGVDGAIGGRGTVSRLCDQSACRPVVLGLICHRRHPSDSGRLDTLPMTDVGKQIMGKEIN